MGKQTVKQKRVALLMVGALLVAVFAAAPVYAQIPVPPQAFYGTVEISGQPARVGTIIEARGTNVEIGIAGNPITTTLVGQYGSKDLSSPKLTVQGDLLVDGSPIEFYINGFKAECAVPGGPWQSSFPFQSQAVTELNLKVHLFYTFLPLILR